MKNIRSNSIAALSLVLLLSTPAVHSMETAKSLLSSAKGLFGSVVSGCSALPGLAVDAKNMVSTQATALYEAAKEHPRIAAAIALPVAALTGYGVYKAGQKTHKAIKSRKVANAAVNAVLATIRTEVLNDLDAIKADLNSGTKTVKRERPLAVNLLPLIDQLPASQQAIKDQLQIFGAAVTAWDKVDDSSAVVNSTDLLKDAFKAVRELNKLGLNINRVVKPSLKQKLSALATKKTALWAAAVATPVVAYAASNGYFDGAINAVSNVDYSGRLAQAQNAVAPVTGFVANHPRSFGFGLGVPAVYAGSYGVYHFANNRIAKAKAAKALKPAPEFENDLTKQA